MSGLNEYFLNMEGENKQDKQESHRLCIKDKNQAGDWSVRGVIK